MLFKRNFLRFQPRSSHRKTASLVSLALFMVKEGFKSRS
ncbi:hypothetical protein Arad_1544 [Rhizobium rhizogenes K84]|uniref:Uncharacterized protein n=1 Tax=Rhizobium rhizogenes (strain K84 / ATCC BAA-868) TaxID=311403 RepID=B9JC40_RHIR8|nr:hypothetical protein Arad_1544 [Rhizobium rhizogenes K84]